MGFIEQAGRNLEGHRSIGQVALARQEDAAEGAAPQFRNEKKTEPVHSRTGQTGHALGQALRGFGIGVMHFHQQPRMDAGADAGGEPVLQIDSVGGAFRLPELLVRSGRMDHAVFFGDGCGNWGRRG